MAASIQIHNLSKTYSGSTTPALDALTLEVRRGEVYGFLGANGAGKSTTIRLLLNFIQPSGGSAKIMDLDSVTKSVQAKHHIGYLAGDVALYQKATGRELLSYLARLQKHDTSDYRKVLEKRFEAELDKPIANLSKGNRQKIGILQALMHQPDVLILDEPTSGLDPLMQEAFYDSLREAKNRGAAILMSSHNLTEAQAVCDRVGIIKHGKLIREEAIQNMDAVSTAMPVFKVLFADPASIKQLRGKPELTIISQLDVATLTVQPTKSIAAALGVLAKFDIHNISTEKQDLENDFLEFYGDNV